METVRGDTLQLKLLSAQVERRLRPAHNMSHKKKLNSLTSVVLSQIITDKSKTEDLHINQSTHNFDALVNF